MSKDSENQTAVETMVAEEEEDTLEGMFLTFPLGNEEYGCSKETLAMADYLLTIPLYGRKNSLNVSNAFAIAAQEICRQKRNIYYEN